MIKELLHQLKIFSVLHEEQRGSLHLALGHPSDTKKWLAFVLAALMQQPKQELSFSKIYRVQDKKLVMAWQVACADPQALKEIIDNYIQKPEWLRNYGSSEEIVDGQRIIRQTLIGDPIDPPDPRKELGTR